MKVEESKRQAVEDLAQQEQDACTRAGLERFHDRDMAAKQTKLDRIAFWFPDIPQMAATADYCREIGFSEPQTVDLLKLRPVQYTGALRSPKSGRSYEADNITACLERRAGTGVGMGAGVGANTSTPGFTLTINGTPILQWFKSQFEKSGKAMGIKVSENRPNRGVKL